MTENATPIGAEVCHIEIPAPDLASAKKFYSTVFGWIIQENSPSPDYWFFTGGNIGGAFDSRRKVTDEGVCLILKVEDIPSKLEEIVRAGGKKISEKTALPDNMGYVASFRDPNRLKMELWSKN